MKHGSLFSGIGGFDLAAEWMGWENVFHCDNNKFCQRILKYYWPDAKSYEDIKQTDFTEWNGRIDIVTGGFPCQPYSQAGKRKGKADDRHLWPQMLRAIREIKPNWVVAENVYGIVNWQRGMVFEEVLSDLENEGYFTQAYILPACAKNAPHRRDRTWFVAYASNIQRSGAGEVGQQCGNRRQSRSEFERTFGKEFTSDTGFERPAIAEKQTMGNNEFFEGGINSNSQFIGQSGQGRSERQLRTEAFGNGQASWAYADDRWPTVSPIRRGDDGFSPKLVKQCLEALGNAIVPQIALEIFKAIEQVEGQ